MSPRDGDRDRDRVFLSLSWRNRGKLVEDMKRTLETRSARNKIKNALAEGKTIAAMERVVDQPDHVSLGSLEGPAVFLRPEQLQSIIRIRRH